MLYKGLQGFGTIQLPFWNFFLHLHEKTYNWNYCLPYEGLWALQLPFWHFRLQDHLYSGLDVMHDLHAGCFIALREMKVVG